MAGKSKSKKSNKEEKVTQKNEEIILKLPAPAQVQAQKIEWEEGKIEWEEGQALISRGLGNLRKRVEGNFKKDELCFSYEEFMQVYLTICQLCFQDHHQQLYEMYRKSFELYISLVVLPALSKEQGGDGEFICREFEKCWENYKIMVQCMSHMFSHLDRYFVRRKTGVVLPSLRAVALLCFRELVYDHVRVDVKNGVLDLINREREGEKIGMDLVKHVVNVFLEIGNVNGMDSYKNHFEKPIFEDTATYYARKAALWIVQESLPQYMLKVEECLKHEKHKVAPYLHSSSEHNLMDIVEYELLFRYETQLLEKQDSCCRVLFRDDKKDDLSRMYRLFGKIRQGLEPVACILKEHVTTEAIALIKWAEDAGNDKHEYVPKLIEIHGKYKSYVEHEFQKHKLILLAFREAFSVMFDKRVGGSTSVELLAEFCDGVLRKPKLMDDHIESIFQKIGELVYYVTDKDLFVESCNKKLAKRLLFDRRMDIDHEQNILSELKKECGTLLTSKMQGMLNDFTASKEIQASFTANSNTKLTISLGVKVLNTAVWPKYKCSKLNIPSEMFRCVEAFNEFYHEIHKGRQLTWIYSLGTCDIISRFDIKTIEITGSTCQAAVLLLFNDAGQLSYQEIQSQLNLEEEEVAALLHSLACGKYNILLKNPVNKSISSGDHFEFNPKFTHKLTKIKIPLPQLVDVQEKKVTEGFKQERGYVIDCVIARIMKVRKVLSQQQLISECVEQLQKIFKPEIKCIKKRINELITREILECDEEDSTVLTYVA